ncbi:MAG: SDR family oxidoreductase [Pseudomonadales bacterium]
MAGATGARVAGKVALVTGAASPRGIGRGCVERLAEEGATVFGADVDVAAGRAGMAELAAHGLDTHFIELDVTSEVEWQAAIDTVLERAGRLDVLVNNAGVAFAASIADTSLERFRWLNGINLRGTYLGVKHAVIAMRRNDPSGGSIINLSSVAGHVGLPGYTAYCASKGGVKNLTRAAALECGAARDGIRVNSVHPGVIWTPMNEVNFSDESAARAGVDRMTPLGRLGYPRDIADGVLFLASDDASYMTGAFLTIDGGLTAA